MGDIKTDGNLRCSIQYQYLLEAALGARHQCSIFATPLAPMETKLR
jgi:hypothetical protein